MYGFLAMLYVSMGRFDDAQATLAKGYKIDPLFPVLPAVEVSVHFFARNYDQAIACGRKSLELHPYILVGRCYYAQALDYAGRLDEALTEYRTTCTVLPGLSWLRALEGVCLSKAGHLVEASAVLEELDDSRRANYIDAYYMALLSDALGLRDRAFAELERAVEEKSITLSLIAVDPKIDRLRQDPRFANVLQQIFPKAAASPSDSLRRLSTGA